MKKPIRRRLFFDIETSPNVGLFWESGFNLTVLPESVVKERAVICIGYKWEDEKRVHCPTWDQDQNDKDILEHFINVMNQADEVIAHNGDNFDITWLRTRCLFHGIPMIPNYVSIDTFKAARGKFKFNSNKLDYIGQFLGVGNKIKTSYDLWKQVLLDNDRKALARMVKYCKQDVLLLQKVFDKMNPYLVAKTNAACYTQECPECGGGNTTIQKRRTTASGYKKIQFQCSDCGKYHTIAESKFNKNKAI